MPKIECPPRSARTVLRAPQTVEQLMEVPTPVSPILLYFSGLWSRTLTIQFVVVEVRNVDLQGFLPGQGPTAPFLSLERISEQIVEQTVDIRCFRWRPSRFSPRTEFILSCALSSCLAQPLRMSRFNGFFALFPQKKKVQLSPGTWVREGPGTSAHPRRLLMARALGWTTTRVRFGRCSRIRRSARGGTARACTAPSGTRRGSAEFGCCWCWWTSLCSCRDVVLLAVLRPG